MQVLGERRLLQQEVLSELAQDVDSQAPFLHIAVRLADIQSAYFSNTAGQQLTFDLGGSNAEDRRPRRSALTSALAQGATVPADATSNRQVSFPCNACTKPPMYQVFNIIFCSANLLHVCCVLIETCVLCLQPGGTRPVPARG